MRFVIQRVLESEVKVDGESLGTVSYTHLHEDLRMEAEWSNEGKDYTGRYCERR